MGCLNLREIQNIYSISTAIHSLSGVEVVGDDAAGLEGHLDALGLEDPGDLDVGPAGLLVLLRDHPLVGRRLAHRRRHLAAVGGLKGKF